eukprot:TRINITY_DN3755_c1_g2_i1.p1 TRINITY_DN3755_c1_g2~~TRINITY_DN3755_c1_g2_i1.p1  ORF type:complete len:938 (-),score=146.23 TRINITY_DN3755_c1_g2_i1:425-3238(-)
MGLKFWVALVALCTLVNGNYYRFGSMTWQRLNVNDTSGIYTVEFTVVLGINDPSRSYPIGSTYNFEGIVLDFGDGTNSSLASTVIQRDAMNGTIFTNPILQHNYSSPGPWNVSYASGPIARWAKLRLNGLLAFRMVAKIGDLRTDFASPVIRVPYIVRFQPGQTDWALERFDPDGDTVTCRLGTAYELGDPLVRATDGSLSQQSFQPDLLTVNTTTCQLSWTIPPCVLDYCYYNAMVFFMDGKGAEVAVDFVLENIDMSVGRPVIGGDANTPRGPPSAPEVFLINEQIVFSIFASSPSASTSVIGINCTEPNNIVTPLTTTVNGTGLIQQFAVTPLLTGIRDLCFIATTNRLDQSVLYCFRQAIAATPLLFTQWQVPTKQLTKKLVEVWFSGFFLSGLDRVAQIPAAQSCASLLDTDGLQVLQAAIPVNRTSAAVINYQQTYAVFTTGEVGVGRVCYKLNAGKVYVPWTEVAGSSTFDITQTGPYQVTSEVSCPVVNRPFTFIIDGVDLRRFDRIKFFQPSTTAPQISSTTCEQLSATDGTMVRDFPAQSGLLSGFVEGAERVYISFVLGPNDGGQYFCYKPLLGSWRLLAIADFPRASGIWKVVSNVELGSQANITLQGDGLTVQDTWAAHDLHDDCSVITSGTPVFSASQGANNTPSVLVTRQDAPGINLFSLCYQHQGENCKIQELSFSDQPYNYIAIPDPISTTRLYPWANVQPFFVTVNSSYAFEFTGFTPYAYNNRDPCVGCNHPWVKVAAHGTCDGQMSWGAPRELDSMRRARFTFGDVGVFRFCIKHRIDWEPVSRVVEATPPPPTDGGFDGYPSCRQWLASPAGKMAQGCGCYVSNSMVTTEDWVTLALDTDWDASDSVALNVNQGCCSNENANRTRVSAMALGSTREWGYCTHRPANLRLPNTTPAPCEVLVAADGMVLGPVPITDP